MRLSIKQKQVLGVTAMVAIIVISLSVLHLRNLARVLLLESRERVELELEPEVFTPERIRADEEVFAASGRTKYTTVALAADGAVAGYSEIVVPRHDPGRAYQWGTLVRRADRGHRLGLATKAHNLAWVQREEPDLRLLVTFNAEVNVHMVGVNEQLGFRPVERLGEFQRQLG